MKKVVIVGGGFTGLSAAVLLEKKFDVLLVSEDRYFTYLPALHRQLSLSLPRSARIKISELLKNSIIVSEKAIRVNSEFVFTKSAKIDFDYLVIAAGSTYLIPIDGLVGKVADFFSAKKCAEKTAGSDKVLVVGGGFTGVECASELAEAGKEVTLVHSKSFLLGDKNASAKALEELRNLSVKVIFNERIIDSRGRKFIGKSEYEADYCVWCAGTSIDNSFLKGFGFDENGRILVNDFLQVKGEKFIFSGGDIGSTREEKTAQNAIENGLIIADNIVRMEKGHKLRRHKVSETPLLVSFGSGKAMLKFGNLSFINRLFSVMKKAGENYWFLLFKYPFLFQMMKLFIITKIILSRKENEKRA